MSRGRFFDPQNENLRPHDPLLTPESVYTPHPDEEPFPVTIDQSTWNQATAYAQGAGNITLKELVEKFNLTPSQAAAALDRLRDEGVAYEQKTPTFTLPIPPSSKAEHTDFENGERKAHGFKAALSRKIGRPIVKQTVEYATFKAAEVGQFKKKVFGTKKHDNKAEQNPNVPEPATPLTNRGRGWQLEIDTSPRAYTTYSEEFALRSTHSRTSHNSNSETSSPKISKTADTPEAKNQNTEHATSLDEALRLSLEHIGGFYSESNNYKPLPRLSIESLKSLLSHQDDIKDEDIRKAYDLLHKWGILDKKGNVTKDQSDLRTMLEEEFGVSVPSHEMTREEVIKLAETSPLMIYTWFNSSTIPEEFQSFPGAGFKTLFSNLSQQTAEELTMGEYWHTNETLLKQFASQGIPEAITFTSIKLSSGPSKEHDKTVMLAYETTTRGTDTDYTRSYIDAFGRPGNMLRCVMLLPESTAAELRAVFITKPAFVHEFIESLMKDHFQAAEADWAKLGIPYDKWRELGNGISRIAIRDSLNDPPEKSKIVSF